MPISAPPFAELGPWSDVAGFAVGAAAMLAYFRLWAGSALTPRFALFAVLLATAMHAPALFTTRLEIPADNELRLAPWSENGRPPLGFEVPHNPLLTDVTQVLLPFRTEAARRLLRLELPFWSHELGVGQPLLGNGQAAVFSPFQLLTLPFPVARAMTLVSGWGLLLALLGTYLLAREIGASVGGAAVSAIAFALSTFGIAWQYHPLGLAAAHLPALAWAVLRLTTSDPRALAGASALVASFLLAGNPEPAAMALFPALVLAILRLRSVEQRDRARFAARLAIAGALGLALAAPAWIPLLSTARESARVAAIAADPTHMSPPPASLAELATFVQPLAKGWPVAGGWIGEGQDNWAELASGYAGLLPLALAIGSLFAPALGTRTLLAAGGVALLFALRLPVIGDFWLSIPGLQLLPLSRFRWLWVLSVALSAGLVISRLGRLTPTGRRRLAFAAAGTTLLFVATARIDAAGPADLRWIALAAALALAAAVALASGMAPRRIAFATAFALLLDLGWLGLRFQPLVSAEMDFRTPSAVRWLQARTADEPGPVRVAALEGRLLPYLGSLYGLWDPRGYDAMRPAAALSILRARLGDDRPTGPVIIERDASLELLPRLGVRFLMTGPTLELPAPWSRVLREPWLAIWEDPRALPLFFAPRRTVPAGSRASANHLAAWDLPPTEAVALEGWRPAKGDARVTLHRITAVNNGFDLEIAATNGGVIASSVAWMPGWRVVQSGAAEIERIDGAFLGLRVAAAVDRIELRYSPPGWHLAIALFLFGAGGLIFVTARAFARSAADAPAAPAGS